MNTLAKRPDIEQLVNEFAHAEATVRRCFADMASAMKSCNNVFALGHQERAISVHFSRLSERPIEFDHVDSIVAEMRRSAWKCIVERLQLRRIMSLAAWKDLEDRIKAEKCADVPPITYEMVAQFAEHNEAKAFAMLVESVGEVFEWLRPRRSHHKSNSEYEVPAKIVLEGIVESPKWSLNKFQVRYDCEQRLIALENVFDFLDGRDKPRPAYHSEMSGAISQSSDGIVETDMFAVKAYKNGNLHIQFKRADLLAKFNQIAGGKRLRKAAA